MKKADHNGSQKVPHYQRIARQLNQAIENGELAPGSRLPASRVYAQELGVSRATIENAWGELVAQAGWSARPGGHLCQRAPKPAAGHGSAPDGRPGILRAAAFSNGATGTGSFPRGVWARVDGAGGYGRNRASTSRPAIPAANRFSVRRLSTIYVCRAASSASRSRL